jgi:transposase-like protein
LLALILKKSELILMGKRFVQSFKIQAVEKTLNRHNDVSVKEIADTLGVGYSTVQKGQSGQ